MNDILVVKNNFACDRECDVKVEKCTQKDNTYNNCNTCYDIQKRYGETDTLCTTSKEELSKRIIPKDCSMCLYSDSLPNEDPCKSCEYFSNFIF